MKRSSLQVILSLALVFLSGAVVGAFGHRLYSARSVQAGAPRRLSPEEYRQKYIQELETRLKLDASQRQRLVEILDESHARYKSARQRMDPEMKQIQMDQRNQVRQMLKPEQLPEYEKMLEERDRQRRELGHKFGGGL